MKKSLVHHAKRQKPIFWLISGTQKFDFVYPIHHNTLALQEFLKGNF